jgi:hypothetical protein
MLFVVNIKRKIYGRSMLLLLSAGCLERLPAVTRNKYDAKLY